MTLKAGGTILWDGNQWMSGRGVSVWRQTTQEGLTEQCLARATSVLRGHAALAVELHQR